MRGQVPWLSLFLGAAVASAGTFPVNPDGSGQYPSIQAAIDAAAQGDTVLCAPGVYSGAGNKDISLLGKDICVIGSGGPEATKIDCEGSGRGFTIHEGESAAALIQGFRIADGDPPTPSSAAGGAIRIQNASPTLKDLILEDCHTQTWGGGLYLNNSYSAITDLLVRDNSADDYGGGIGVNDVELTLTRVLITGNTATDDGGGIYSIYSQMDMTQITLANNTSSQSGGGIYVKFGQFYFQASLIALNHSIDGGIFGDLGSSASDLSCSDVYGNEPGDYAGSIPDQTGQAGNISEDPLFCDAQDGDFHLNLDSPCLPGNNECGAQMGVFGRGCSDLHYLISGRIRDDADAPMAGVLVQGGPDEVFTDALGEYGIDVWAGWSGIISPQARGYTFEPPERCYPPVGGNQPDQEYVGTHRTSRQVPEDYPTIQLAIDQSLPGDTVFVAPGTYSGEGNRNIDFGGIDLVLIGTGGPDSTIIDLGGSHRGFRFHGGETRDAVVSGFRIHNGYAHDPGGPAFLIEGASPTLNNLKLWNNIAAEPFWYPGGGAICSLEGSPLIRNILVTETRVTGIFIRGGAPHLIDVTVRDCDSYEYEDGGGINCLNSAALLENVTIQDCWTYAGRGGGMAIFGSPAPTLINVLIEGCWSIPELGGGYGGGIYCYQSSPVLQGVVLRGNESENGPGMSCTYGSPSLQDVIFADNRDGFALSLVACSAHLENLTFDRNQEGALGCASGSAPTLINCIFGMSTAGPGISADASSAPTLACCDIYGNAGGPFGGSMPNWIGIDGNFAADPLYCGDENPGSPLSLASSSPCAPANNDCGAQIGALPVGCDIAAYLISGRVIDGEGQPLPGVEMAGLFPPLSTDEEGEFILWRLAGWSGELLPRLPGFVFDPVVRAYSEVSGDFPDQDFIGERRTVHHVPAQHANLSDAFEAVLAGDTILVAPGTYSGPANVALDFGGRDIIVTSEAGADSTIIDCGGYARAFFFGNGESRDAVLEGFTVMNGFGDYTTGTSDGGGILIEDASPTVRRMRIIGCEGLLGGGIHLDDSSALLEEIVLQDCRSGRDGAALHVEGCSPLLRRLTILDNRSDWGGGGLACDYGASPTIENSIIYRNQAGGGGGVFCRDAASAPQIACSDVFGNLMLDSLPGDYGGYAVDPTGAGDNIKADPLFCDPEAGDLHLNANSPCLAAASGCAEDMGAFGQGCAFSTFLIAGSLRGPDGQGLAGARIDGYRHPIFASAQGDYAQSVFEAWSGTLVPRLRGYRFEPARRIYGGVIADMPDEDYSGARVTLRRVPLEFATLQAGLNAAASGDTVLAAPGVYLGSGNRNLDWLGYDVRLISESGPETTVIDCEHEGRGANFHLGETPSALFSGFTITNGSDVGDAGVPSGGGVYIVASSPTLRNLILRENRVRDHGGGLYARNASPVIEDVVVEDNQAYGNWGYGGGMYFENGSPVVTGAVLAGNHSGYVGGAICCTNASPVLTGLTLAGNSALSKGGGVLLRNSSTPALVNCLLAFNSAGSGGGLYVTDAGCLPALICSDVFGNENGDWAGYGSYPAGVDGNIMADPMFCDLEAGDLTVADLSPCLPENNDCGTMIGCLGQGCILTHAADEDLPRAFSLAQNHPNPFNPVTTIRFGLPRAGQVTLRIFSVSGRCVAVPLDRAPLEAGYHDLLWRGVDERGRELASGIYLYRLEAGEFRETKKMTLLR